MDITSLMGIKITSDFCNMENTSWLYREKVFYNTFRCYNIYDCPV